MSEFFPATGKQVVPLVRLEQDDGVTFVRSRQTAAKQEEEGAKIRVFRFALWKLIKATYITIDSKNAIIENGQIERTRPNNIVPSKRE